MTELYNKYNVVHIEGCRYYVVNLKAKEYLFENTLPYCCVIDRVAIYDPSWKGMVFKVAEELDRINPKSTEELLNMKNSWGKQEVFGLKKRSNYQPFKDIFINTNHSAVHAMWTIQLLLNEYNVDLDKCIFLLRRLPLAEPREIREYEKDKALVEFKNFLKVRGYQEADVENIVSSIDMVNSKVLPTIAKGYHDLLLIEQPNYCHAYIAKSLKILKETLRSNISKYHSMEKALMELDKFVKARYKENKIKYDDYKIIDDFQDNFFDELDDFDDF